MKAFLFNSLNRFRRYSEELDTMAEIRQCLCGKAWLMFNDSGDKEVYIFQEDGRLIISINGNITRGSWEYLSVNNSIAISASNQAYMVHPAFLDNILFALQVDGTENYAFLIDQNNAQDFAPRSLDDLHEYFRQKEQKRIEEENRIKEEQRLAELKRIEEEKKEREHKEQKKRMVRLVEKIYKDEVLLKSRFLVWLNDYGFCGVVAFALIFAFVPAVVICPFYYPYDLISGILLYWTAIYVLLILCAYPIFHILNLVVRYRLKKFIKNDRTYNDKILYELVEHHNAINLYRLSDKKAEKLISNRKL